MTQQVVMRPRAVQERMAQRLWTEQMDPRFFTHPQAADSFRQENKGLFSEQTDEKGSEPHGSTLKTGIK